MPNPLTILPSTGSSRPPPAAAKAGVRSRAGFRLFFGNGDDALETAGSLFQFLQCPCPKGPFALQAVKRPPPALAFRRQFVAQRRNRVTLLRQLAPPGFHGRPKAPAPADVS